MRLTTALAPLLLAVLAAPLAWAGVQATSKMVVSSKPESFYAAENLTDGDLKSVWIEGKEGPGLEESFSLDLPRSEVKKVVIFPGHGADEKSFKKYSRLKEISLSWFTMDDDRQLKALKQQNFTFQDTFTYQEIPVENVKLGSELFGGLVKVTIRSVYPGKDFQDTAVAEARVVLDEYPAQYEVTEAPAPLKGLEKDNLIDGSPKVVFISAEPAVGKAIVLDSPGYGLSAMAITTGNLKDPKKLKDYARPKEITVEVDRQVLKLTLKDSTEAQRFELPPLYGYTGSLSGPVKITIDSVYPGTVSQNVAIGEIQLFATSFSL